MSVQHSLFNYHQLPGNIDGSLSSNNLYLFTVKCWDILASLNSTTVWGKGTLKSSPQKRSMNAQAVWKLNQKKKKMEGALNTEAGEST